jgi:hypothetical protein
MLFTTLFACGPSATDAPKENPADSGVSALTGETGLPTPHSASSAHSAQAGHTGHTGLAGPTGHTGSVPTTPEPDFHLVDLNPTSPTLNQVMSPRDQLLRVSGWYFTHAS